MTTPVLYIILHNSNILFSSYKYELLANLSGHGITCIVLSQILSRLYYLHTKKCIKQPSTQFTDWGTLH